MERHYEVTEQEVLTKNIFNKEDEAMMNHLIHKALGLSDDTELDANMKQTPSRYLKLIAHMTEGYRTDPKSFLSKVFPMNESTLADEAEEFDAKHTETLYQNGMVIVKVKLWSLCLHHLSPYTGDAYIAYIPKDKVVGLSKIVRMAKMYGRRFSMQESLCSNIADALMNELDALGSAVLMRNTIHSCVSMRGASESTSETSTITVRGVFTDPKVKNEFLSIVNSAS